MEAWISSRSDRDSPITIARAVGMFAKVGVRTRAGRLVDRDRIALAGQVEGGGGARPATADDADPARPLRDGHGR
ncbi:MAG TPA: hypothetical protein VI248_11775 [Kineosporiaceae bacterium]